MTAGRTALVVANYSDADAGFVGERLEQCGFALRTIFRDSDELPAEVVDDVEIVLTLGSVWSVHTPVDASSLQAECALLHVAAASNVPVLAICYGAQVAAHAFGGSVAAAPRPEVGWIEVETTDPTFVPAGPWPAFHVDVVTVPPADQVVAHNGCGPQAFVLPGLLAVQFHPEVRPLVLDEWGEPAPGLLAGAGLTRAGLLAQSLSREPQARAAAYALVDAILRVG